MWASAPTESPNRDFLSLIMGRLLALVLELAGFNWKAMLTVGKTWTPLPEPTTSGSLAEDGQIGLFFNDLDREISWCHIDVEVRNARGEPVPTLSQSYLSVFRLLWTNTIA